MRRSILLLLISLCAALTFTLSAAFPASAQSSPQSTEDPWALARDAYRNQDWDSARRFTAAASQRDPEEPRYYLSLGRIAFQQGLFEDAVWFYDVFLEYTRLSNKQFSGSYAVERARAERDSANTRRSNPTAPSKEPEAQVRVREALLARLNEGVVLSETGGGALATFQTLLQVGYANPDLTQLRNAVDAAANAEAFRLLQGTEAQFPELSYELWQRQARRYDATRQLTGAAVPFDGGTAVEAPAPNRAYRALAEAQRQYLLQNWSNAEKRFRDAIEANPNLSLAHQGLLNALLASNQPELSKLDEALQGLARADANGRSLPLYRALVDAAKNDASRAATQLHQLLKTGDTSH